MGTHPIFESDFDCLTEKMTESAHDFDILMNDGSTRSMSHYKERFSFGRYQSQVDIILKDHLRIGRFPLRCSLKI